MWVSPCCFSPGWYDVIVFPISPRVRHRVAVLVPAGLLGVILVGCASVPPQHGLANVRRDIQHRSGLRVDWTQDARSDSALVVWTASTLIGEVSVDTAIQVGLLRNKGLQAAFEDLGIARSDLVQSGLLANPVATAASAFARGGGTGITSFGVALPFIDLLQRPLRQRVAAQEFDAARARMSAAVVKLAAEIRIAYVDAQAGEQLLEVRRAVSAALDASATAAIAIHDAGNLSDFDLAQERAQAADARLEVFRAEANVRVTRAELERVMGVNGGQAWTLTPRLRSPSDSTQGDAGLIETAMGRRLDLRATQSDANAAAQRLGLTRAFALLPDGTLGATYERDPDGTFVGGTISVPVPLFDHGQGRVSRNRALLRQALARHDALVQDIVGEVRHLTASLVSAQAREEHLRRVVLPLRHQAVLESQKFANAMEHSVFMLLMVKQAEIDAGSAYVEALRDYWIARAALERAVGGTLAPLTADERAELTAMPSSVGRASPPR